MISKHSMMHQGEELYQIHIYIPRRVDIHVNYHNIQRSSLEWLGSQTRFFDILSQVSDERLQDHWSF